MVLPAGVSPATSAFEARRAIRYATGAFENGAPERFCPAFSAMSVRRSAIDLPARDTAQQVLREMSGPGWICTINLPIQSRALR